MVKFLENYPFKNIGITIGEGFSEYEGTLRHVPGLTHGGIDYVLKKGGEFASFEVYSMYEGDFRFGVSSSLGKYFIVSKVIGDFRYDTIYAHLDRVDGDLQKYAIIQGDKDFVVPSKYFLGLAATSNKNSTRHLHIELHQKNLRTGERKRVDPYGIYSTVTLGRYPQPGEPLAALNHVWKSDSPQFI